MRTRLTHSLASAFGATALAFGLCGPAHSSIVSAFSNTAQITIPSSGAASPYPSAINVSGMGTQLLGLSVSLLGFSHTWARDVDVLLVSPGGQAMLVMSDVGGNNNFVDVNITLSDGAASLMPNTSFASGSYRPTDSNDFDLCGESLPGPAPATTASAGFCGTATLQSTFGGINPNGLWSLYVADDAGGDSGVFSRGWSMTITTNDRQQGSVPEPATLWLVGLAGLGAVAARRRHLSYRH